MRWKTSINTGLVIILLLLAFFVVLKQVDKSSIAKEQIKELQAMSFVMYKDPDCECCGAYARELKKLGVTLRVKESKELFKIKGEHKIRPEMQSCHTIVANNGKFIEGHVPLADFADFMTSDGDFKGISLPGMYPGTPGMPGEKIGNYKIYGIREDGTSKLIKSI